MPAIAASKRDGMVYAPPQRGVARLSASLPAARVIKLRAANGLMVSPLSPRAFESFRDYRKRYNQPNTVVRRRRRPDRLVSFFRRARMSKRFEVGDHVTWNSEAGHVSGRIIKVHTRTPTTRAIRIMPARPTRNMKSRATRPIMWRCTRARR